MDGCCRDSVGSAVPASGGEGGPARPRPESAAASRGLTPPPAGTCLRSARAGGLSPAEKRAKTPACPCGAEKAPRATGVRAGLCDFPLSGSESG